MAMTPASLVNSCIILPVVYTKPTTFFYLQLQFQFTFPASIVVTDESLKLINSMLVVPILACNLPIKLGTHKIFHTHHFSIIVRYWSQIMEEANNTLVGNTVLIKKFN